MNMHSLHCICWLGNGLRRGAVDNVARVPHAYGSRVSWSRERAKIPVENQTSVKGMRARTALENAIWIVDTK